MVPDVVRDYGVAADRVVEARRAAAGALLEVGDQLAARGVDAEEIVDVGRGVLSFRPALRDQRDRAGDAAVTGARADAAARPLEPQLSGERRAPQLAGRAKSHVLVDAVELQSEVGRRWRDRDVDRRGVGVEVAVARLVGERVVARVGAGRHVVEQAADDRSRAVGRLVDDGVADGVAVGVGARRGDVSWRIRRRREGAVHADRRHVDLRHEARDPGWTVGKGAGDVVARAVGRGGAGPLVEAPAAEQAGRGNGDRDVPGGLDLGQAAGVVPHPDLVDDTGEEARCDAAGRPGTADRGQHIREVIGGLANAQRAVERAVEVEAPGRPVVGRRGVVPDVVRDYGVAADRVVEARRAAAGALLEVGDQLAARGVDAEEIVDVGRGVLSFRPALRDQRNRAGDAAVTGARADAGARPLEPQLSGERRAPQLAGRAKSHVLVDAVELQSEVGRGPARAMSTPGVSALTGTTVGVAPPYHWSGLVAVGLDVHPVAARRQAEL